MADKFKYFDIPFAGLSLGMHVFSYQIDETFFANFNQQLPQCKFTVAVTLDKQPQVLGFTFETKGTMEAVCGRCTDSFLINIDASNHLVIKFGLKAAEEDVDVYVLPTTETHINLAQFIYEYIMVAIPMHQVHPLDNKGRSTCNKTFLKQVESHQKANEQLKQQTTDPRWDVLRKINNH